MKLLLDLGNTRLKWAMAAIDGFSARGAAAWDDNLADILMSSWRSLHRPDRVVASSVVDDTREAQIHQLVSTAFAHNVQWVRTPAQACGVRNAYPESQRLGVDRFLAMVAAHAAGQAPCVLAGVGTALTLDALMEDGQHLGGLIAPGPLLMQQSLLGATARVHTDQHATVRDIADNTPDAVVSGCWQAVAALIERFTQYVADEHPEKPIKLLVDGGDAATLLPLLSAHAELAADSVLRGLWVWADSHPVAAAS